jgi:hypothetical protein|nr:NAD(P)/FAD-dependent oxidoreductase [Candidatus Nanoarchaeia archaeon]
MNVIVGGGIAGLIWAKYHTDHFILTDQVGGQMISYFDLGPRYLHNKSKYVEKFLEDLEVPLKLSTIRIGYLDDTGWIDNPGPEFRQKYFMKSRGQNDLKGFDPTVLNTNIKEFQVCDVDFKLLISKLFDQLEERIYMGSITHINLEKQMISTDSNMVLKFSKLVSTIPLNIFARVAGLSIALQSFDMAYCLLSKDFFDLKEFDYVYDARTDTPFHRMTKCKMGVVCDVVGTRIIDFKKYIDPKYFTIPIDQAVRLVKNNQIISLENDFELKDKPVKFVGRYGTWNRRWKTETVIEEAQA